MSASETAAVRAEYEARRAAAEREVVEARATELRLANGRLAVFLVGVAVVIGMVASDAVSAAWLLLPIVGFVWLVVVHDRMRRRRTRSERCVALYEAGLARLDDSWSGTGATGTDYDDPAHPYSAHLDLFGEGSLFQLLCRARTGVGERRLASWLLVPAPIDELRSRHAAVQELAPRVDLRERLALLGVETGDAVPVRALSEWGTAPAALPTGVVTVLTALLPVVTTVTLLAWFPGGGSALPFLLAATVQILFWRRVGPHYAQAIAAAEVSAGALGLVRDLLETLEDESVESEALVELRSRLRADGGAAEAIRALARKLEWAEASHNQFFAPIALLVLWDAWWARSVETWRARHGAGLEGWLDALAEYEALASLSGHVYENPADPLPELVEEGPVFEATAAAHPLLPRDRAVRNDLRLGADRRVHVVSGSNMSGKSTLLRTVGVNTVLALAGAPVRAERLVLSPLQVAASIHVHDSLLDGESRFYAEVSRIGAIVELARAADHPVLFLLDELFHGTNSHDRRLGAAEVVRVLVKVGAVGLLTTHDLELARLAEDLDASVVNVHFEDRFEDGRMSFDYRMRSGVVTRSNALALMRAVGLDV